jgi:drug/metabolite transporter (DMT)-like permease|tara:strand:+ start:72 stop:245 length:174 start_codon:yes stop_codon:yes gene_type:complete
MKKFIWLFLSSFGIMFAILSWFQESGLLDNDLGFKKGLLAVLCGLVLYIFIPSKIDK